MNNPRKELEAFIKSGYHTQEFFAVSDTELIANVTSHLAILCQELLLISDGAENAAKIKTTLVRHLDYFDHEVVTDTEDREGVCSIFELLAQTFHVNIGYELSEWLYGTALANMMSQIKSGNNEILFSNEEPCIKCQAGLRTEVHQLNQKETPDFWQIVVCPSCSSYNLISSVKNAGMMTPYFRLIESLDKSEFSYEQALSWMNYVKKIARIDPERLSGLQFDLRIGDTDSSVPLAYVQELMGIHRQFALYFSERNYGKDCASIHIHVRIINRDVFYAPFDDSYEFDTLEKAFYCSIEFDFKRVIALRCRGEYYDYISNTILDRISDLEESSLIDFNLNILLDDIGAFFCELKKQKDIKHIIYDDSE